MEIVLLAIVLVIFLLAISKLYFKITSGWCSSRRLLTGKTVIVTGATAGIGKETAKDLARRGARVILPVRNLKRGEDAVREIQASSGNADVMAEECDLASLASIRNSPITFYAERISWTCWS